MKKILILSVILLLQNCNFVFAQTEPPFCPNVDRTGHVGMPNRMWLYGNFQGFHADSGIFLNIILTNPMPMSYVGLGNVTNNAQWYSGNHPTTTTDYGLPAYPTTPTGTGWRHVTSGVEDAAASTPTVTQVLGNGTAQYQYIVTGTTPFSPAYSTGGLNITSGKTFACQNSMMLSGSGSDLSTIYFPVTGGTVYVPNNPMTTLGDLLIGSTTATPSVVVRLAAGATGTVFIGNGAGVLPSYSATPTVSTAAAGTNTTQIATTAFVETAVPNASYRSLLEVAGSHIATKVAGTYAIGYGSPLAISGTGTLYPIGLIQIVAADYPTEDGKTTKLRVRATVTVNAVAPTGNFTIGLYPVTSGAGAVGLKIYTMGTLVTGSATTTVTAPAASSMTNVVGSDFALPADGVYCLAVITTATVATSSLVHVLAKLQMRNF